jgi:hypothetical protein
MEGGAGKVGKDSAWYQRDCVNVSHGKVRFVCMFGPCNEDSDKKLK